MKRFCKELVLDLKEPGINIWMIPIVSIVFLISTDYLQNRLGINNLITLSLLEILLPFLGGYASIMIMQSIVDTDGCEILFTYPRSLIYWGIFRQIRLYIIFSLLTALICMRISMIMFVPFLRLYVLTLAQSFSVMSIGFLGVSMSRKVSIGLVALIAFVGIQILLGREIASLNWIYVLSGRLPENGVIIDICIRSLLIGFFCWITGQFWVHP